MKDGERCETFFIEQWKNIRFRSVSAVTSCTRCINDTRGVGENERCLREGIWEKDGRRGESSWESKF